MVFNKIKRAFSGGYSEEVTDNEYLEIDIGSPENKNNKVLVKLFTIKQYEDVNDVLTALREGFTIAVIDVKKLRQKDSLELKRAVSKIKKTTDALEGDIKGFSNEQPDMIVVTPSFAKIEKNIEKVEKKPKERFDDLY